MIRKLLYICALLLLMAAMVSGILDCAKSVALSAVNFTFMTDFLASFSMDTVSHLKTGGVFALFIYKCLYYMPVWFAFLSSAAMLYCLAAADWLSCASRLCRLNIFRPAR